MNQNKAKSLIFPVAEILRKVSPLTLLPVYAANLSLAEFGLMELYVVLSTLLAFIIGFGSFNLVLRFSKKSFLRSYIITKSILYSTTIVLLVVFLFAIAYLTLQFDDPLLIFVIVLQCYLLVLYNLSLAVFRIFSQYFKMIVSSFIFIVCQFSFVFILIEEYGVFAKFLSAFLTYLVLIILFYKSVFGEFRIKYIAITKHDFGYFKHHLSVTWNNVIGVFSNSIDKIIIVTFVGLDAFGLYSFILQIVQAPKIAMEAVLKSIVVKLYNDKTYFSAFLHYNRRLEIGVFVLLIGYFITVNIVYNIWSFGQFGLNVELLALLLLSRFFMIISISKTYFLYKLNLFAFVANVNFQATFIKIVVLFVLIHFFGLIGAGVGALVVSFLVYARLNLKWRETL